MGQALVQPGKKTGDHFIVIFNYAASSPDEINCKVGDEVNVLNGLNEDWCQVYNLNTNRKGCVPRSYIAKAGSLASKKWFFDSVTSKEASNLLLSYPRRGTYLVRFSGKERNGYALSVVTKNTSGNMAAKHYTIRKNENYFYIERHDMFPSLDELIKHYEDKAYGICERLRYVCRKPKPPLYDLTPIHRKNWEIEKSDIRLIQRLGSGNFGDVWLGLWRKQVKVAVKTLKKGAMTRQEFLQEAAIMKRLRHKKLVALYAICSKSDPSLIITEFMKHGALLDFLRKRVNKIPFATLIYFSVQIASGMAFLEKENVVHRDLAARNVLVTSANIVKVADFGLARKLCDGQKGQQNNKFPLLWTAPEAILAGKFTTKSDVWSFGILLYEIFTYGGSPYPQLDPLKVPGLIIRGYRMRIPQKFPVPPNIYDTMKKCWNANADARPSFAHLEDYFNDYETYIESQYELTQP